ALAGFKPDACIHLAWYAEPGKYLHSTENLSSLRTSLDLFRELIASGCRQIVAAGTCAEYAPSKSPLKEDSPTHPTTLYAASKLACFLVGRQLADSAKIKFAWGRIFYPYGPKEDERRVVPAVIQSLLKGHPFPATSGKQLRDYIFVEDVASAFCAMAEKSADGVFNVCSGKPVAVRSLLENAGKKTGRVELIQFGAKPQYAWEPPLLAGDNRRLRSLGWKPCFGLDEGMEKTVQWWKTNS
ncbi:MAG TPA: NAD(P)-dependent oxidoreductase, partial [bacterium]|nr:NAD(P)-dependent oxidoreductase [bacterium]